MYNSSLGSCNCIHFSCTDGTGEDLYSPEAESSQAPSSGEPTPAQMVAVATKPTSRTSSFEIENLLKTAEQVRVRLTISHAYTHSNTHTQPCS